MKALVTGGTGFVGSHLIVALREAGDDVRAIVRSERKRGEVESLGAESVSADLDDAESLVRACEGCDVVYHAAARVEIVGSEAEFQKTTVDGTRRALEAAAANRVGRFVQVSSCGIYHPKLFKSGQEIDEFTPTPMPPAWFPYGRAKLRAEELVRQSCPPEMEWVIVRLGYLFGPGNRTMKTHVEPAMRDSLMSLVGNGDNEMAMVYVADVARAIMLAGRVPRAARQILIAGGFERVTQRQYFDAMADCFGIPRVTRRTPYWLAFLAGMVGERIFRKAPRRDSIRRSAIALTGLPQRVSCRHTQELIGWKPEVTFADGMSRAAEWFRSEYGQ